MELLADRWLVDGAGTLVYDEGGPFVLRSPLYMPFAWALILVPLGYLGLRLATRFPLAVVSVFVALVGSLYVPLYEEWARGSSWWYYGSTSMLGSTPWYIIGGEFLMALALPAGLSLVREAEIGWRVALGLLDGLWIWAAYAIALALRG